MLSNNVRSLFLCVFILCCWASCCCAGNTPKGNSMFGIKIGIFGDGDIKIDDKRISVEGGNIYGAFLDIPVYKRLCTGFAVDIGDYDFRVENSQFLDVSLVLKLKLGNPNQKVFLRPAVAFGYGKLNKVLNLSESSYFTIQVFSELLLMLNNRLGILCDLGWLSAPSGGDDTYSVTASSRVMLRAGIVF